MKELTIRLMLEWGILTYREYLAKLWPEPKYTTEDCRDFDPAEIGF